MSCLCIRVNVLQMNVNLVSLEAIPQEQYDFGFSLPKNVHFSQKYSFAIEN